MHCIVDKNYLRTPHIGHTRASDVACPVPSPPSSRNPKLFTNHRHHQARYLIRFLPDFSSDFFPIIPSDFFAISHQMSSRLLIQVSLLSLSRISEKTTDVGFRDVQLRPNQVPLSQRPLTVFIRRALFSSKFRCLRSDFICCCNRGCLPTARRGKSLSIRRTKFSSRRSGSWREQQLQLNRRKM